MYSYENYHKVKDEIESSRLASLAEADARCEKVRALSPEIAEIDNELSTTGPLIFRTAISGGDIAPLKARNEQLNRRRREILVTLGLPADYTDVHYSCKKCSDTGYIDGARMCTCFKEGLVKATIASSGMGRLIETQSFDNFSLDVYPDGPQRERMTDNLEAAREYVEGFAKNRENLLLIGKTGTGKTHISTAIAREVISRGYDVLYDSAQNILSDFEDDQFRRRYDEEPKGKKYLECDLLIIDDLGAEFTTPFTVSCLYNLLNTRQNRALATVISTNLSNEDLSRKYEDRIYSRIMGNGTRILVFVGPDRRIG